MCFLSKKLIHAKWKVCFCFCYTFVTSQTSTSISCTERPTFCINFSEIWQRQTACILITQFPHIWVSETKTRWKTWRRRSHRRRSVRKVVLRNFAKFTGKHLRQSLLFNKVSGLDTSGRQLLSVLCNFGTDHEFYGSTFRRILEKFLAEFFKSPYSWNLEFLGRVFHHDLCKFVYWKHWSSFFRNSFQI